MKISKLIFLLFVTFTFINCATGYKMVEPNSISYTSGSESDGVSFSYKYGVLDKKYKKKEFKKNVKLVAVKITNKSGKDIAFGKEAKLTRENGELIYVLDNTQVFKELKQQSATYLLYLLLTPITFNVTDTNSNGTIETSSTPIGLVIGPGIAAGNIIVAESANKKFKNEMFDYNLNGTIIKDGETKYGLIGIRTDSFEALKLEIQ